MGSTLRVAKALTDFSIYVFSLNMIETPEFFCNSEYGNSASSSMLCAFVWMRYNEDKVKFFFEPLYSDARIFVIAVVFIELL